MYPFLRKISGNSEIESNTLSQTTNERQPLKPNRVMIRFFVWLLPLSCPQKKFSRKETFFHDNIFNVKDWKLLDSMAKVWTIANIFFSRHCPIFSPFRAFHDKIYGRGFLPHHSGVQYGKYAIFHREKPWN